MTTRRLFLLLQTVALLSLSSCWWSKDKKTTTATEQEAASLAEVESALITQVTSEEHFATMLRETSKVLVLKFDAPWCSACTVLHPLLVEAAKQSPDLAFARLNIDQLAAIGQQYKIVGIPTLLFFKDGKEVPNSRLEGPDVKNADELLKLIQASAKQADAAPTGSAEPSAPEGKPVAVVADATNQ